MNKIALRAAVATALIAPAVVLGAGAASAQPTVTPGAVGAPFDAEVDPGLGVCLIMEPGFQIVAFAPGTVKGTAAADPVSGTCVGLPYFIGSATGTVE
ncbi:MAG: hypothetical protein WAX14_11645 [Rhodococcus sp. (in: high G+C Gram-positive bacteria)]|uniref:hypothetical protein n=1 Tax=Rhodococcus sp. TaxID=1831 RepID=UPI003BB6BA64